MIAESTNKRIEKKIKGIYQFVLCIYISVFYDRLFFAFCVAHSSFQIILNLIGLGEDSLLRKSH